MKNKIKTFKLVKVQIFIEECKNQTRALTAHNLKLMVHVSSKASTTQASNQVWPFEVHTLKQKF